jgi:Raf kinase inhibitor-like YbhB/YbcL family protein
MKTNMNHTRMALALALSIVGSACGGDDGGAAGAGGGGGAGGGVAPAGEATFAAIFTDIMTKGSVGNCTFGGCHGGVPSAANGNLQLFAGDRNATYAALVGKASSAACMGQTYVVPGQPEQSVFYTKLLEAPSCGLRMPLNGMLTAGQIEQIRLWIANGAMNDGTVPMTGGAGGMTGGAGGMTGGMGGTAGMMTGGMGGMTGGMGGAGAGGMTGGMGGDGGMTGGMGGMAGGEFTLTSTAFEDGGMLPMANRCESLFGAGGPSPALAWSNAPAGTMSFALTLTDNSNQFAHWTIFDIPASTTMLPANVPPGDTGGGGKQSANNDLLAGPGYFGPCGQTENPYEFELYAISVAALPGVTSASDRAAVQTAIDANSLGSVSIIAMSGP